MHFKILVTLAAIATTAYADPSVQAKPKTEPVCNPKACQKAVNIQRDSCVDAFKKAHSIKVVSTKVGESCYTKAFELMWQGKYVECKPCGRQPVPKKTVVKKKTVVRQRDPQQQRRRYPYNGWYDGYWRGQYYNGWQQPKNVPPAQNQVGQSAPNPATGVPPPYGYGYGYPPPYGYGYYAPNANYEHRWEERHERNDQQNHKPTHSTPKTQSSASPSPTTHPKYVYRSPPPSAANKPHNEPGPDGKLPVQPDIPGHSNTQAIHAPGMMHPGNSVGPN